MEESHFSIAASRIAANWNHSELTHRWQRTSTQFTRPSIEMRTSVWFWSLKAEKGFSFRVEIFIGNLLPKALGDCNWKRKKNLMFMSFEDLTVVLSFKISCKFFLIFFFLELQILFSLQFHDKSSRKMKLTDTLINQIYSNKKLFRRWIKFLNFW